MDSLSAQPQTDRRELDEGKIVGGELVVAGGDTSALLDPVEEPLDQVSRPVKVRAEADRLLAITSQIDPNRKSAQISGLIQIMPESGLPPHPIAVVRGNAIVWACPATQRA